MGRRVNRQYSPHGYTTPKPKHSTVPSSELPKPSIKIGEDMAATKQGPVSNTRAARKANSPKAKAKALKSVNKNPMTPAREGAYNASEIGMERSDASADYQLARGAEKRLAIGTYPPEPPKPATTTWAGKEFPADQRTGKERDEDIVGSYKATGTAIDAGWLKKNGSKVRKDMYG
jgi:hypothetical protein